MPNFGKSSALKDEMTPTLAFIAFFSSLGAFTFGFDNGWWSGVLGHPYFNEVFGLVEVTSPITGITSRSLSATQQSVGTALGTAGIAIGCMIAGVIASRIGRRNSFYVTALGSFIGVAVQITSGINGGRYWQLVAGKLIVCISIGVASVSVPLYLAECAPAAIRGALVNTYVIVQGLGGFIATAVLYAVLTKNGPEVWCIPIGLQLLAPIGTLVCCHMLPESPRWLVEKGRHDDARASLMHLRRGKAGYNPDEDLAAIEMAWNESLTKASVGWGALFRGRNLQRTLIVLGIQCLQQGQGISFMANYLIIFFIQLGIQNPYTILLIVTGFLVILTSGGFYVQDYFGRRMLLVIGGAVMAASLIAVGGITTYQQYPTGALANTCVALIVVWLVAFTQSWTSIPWTISAEVPSDHTREKTLALGAFGGYVTGMIIGFVNPYMQNPEYGNLGGKVGFVYGSVSVASVVWCYFFIPEVKGRALEEVDYMFDNGVPIRKMGTFVMPTLPSSLPMEHEDLDSKINSSKEQDIHHLNN